MTTPIPAEDLPKALAEAMGWEEWDDDAFQPPVWYYMKGNKCLFPRKDFKPHLSHDHADICIRECKNRGVIESYLHDLVGECGAWDEGDNWRFDLMVLATPEQKSRAALSALQLTNR